MDPADGDGGTVRLQTGSPMDDDRTAACLEQLRPTQPADTTVLAVTLTDTPDAWLRRFRAQTDALPARIGLVVVGGHARSTSAIGGTDGWHLPPTESISVTSIDDPGDLTALGIKINEFVEQWSAGGDTGTGRLNLCFESLTVLLQYADLERVFRFLHVLVARLRETGVDAHFHIDPSTQDEQTLVTLASLFDDVEGELPAPGHHAGDD